jgi:hypothetical protein
MLSESMAKVYKNTPSLHLARLAFGPDRTHLSDPNTCTDFVLERREGISFENNRYFSSAPLPTQLHIEMLTFLEARMV